jgi:fatty acid desaturase
MSLGRYILCFVYPGLMLSLIRSFAEHRAEPAPGHRVAIVERAPVFGLLFLNNNLHAAHHAWPGLAWWRLPQHYRRHRAALLAGNGGLVYDGYAEVFARFFLRPHDVGEYPIGRED